MKTRARGERRRIPHRGQEDGPEVATEGEEDVKPNYVRKKRSRNRKTETKTKTRKKVNNARTTRPSLTQRIQSNVYEHTWAPKPFSAQNDPPRTSSDNVSQPARRRLFGPRLPGALAVKRGGQVMPNCQGLKHAIIIKRLILRIHRLDP